MNYEVSAVCGPLREETPASTTLTFLTWLHFRNLLILPTSPLTVIGHTDLGFTQRLLCTKDKNPKITRPLYKGRTEMQVKL